MATNTEDPQWIFRDATKPAKIAVVFVHGIFGSTKGTWTNDNGTTFFQLLKADPEVGPKVDVFAFGFESKMFNGGGSLDVREGANKLKLYLYSEHVLDYPVVVFVGHSMGGLVVLRYLASNIDRDSSLSGKVPLVVLYASPQEGAQIASIAKLALENPALAHMTPVNDNLWLQQLTDDWTSVKKKPQIVCGYEKAQTSGVLVVPWNSSTRFCTEPGQAIDGANHIDIVKPDRPTHPSVVLLTTAMRRFVLPKLCCARLEMPDFTRHDDGWHFLMDSNMKTARIMNLGSADLKYWIADKKDAALYILPDESGATLAGESSQNLKLLLMLNAKASRYTFHLKTNTDEDETIVVDVPDIDRIRQQTSALAQDMLSNINSYLASSDQNGASANEVSTDKLASVAYKTIDENLPDLPGGEKWVVTADLLSAASLDTVAAQALRKADISSDKAARSPYVLNLATHLQRVTRETQFFKGAPPQEFNNYKLNQLSPNKAFEEQSDTSGQEMFKGDANTRRLSIELAENMKKFPNLAESGDRLEASVKPATGDRGLSVGDFTKEVAIGKNPALRQEIKIQQMKN
ncbi:esterase/lipase family protein [Paraburkholderia caffeinitolerans]|nr:alpha/beta fold hydrolase [Paraburkholderia caffeinitolerans]